MPKRKRRARGPAPATSRARPSWRPRGAANARAQAPSARSCSWEKEQAHAKHRSLGSRGIHILSLDDGRCREWQRCAYCGGWRAKQHSCRSRASAACASTSCFKIPLPDVDKWIAVLCRSSVFLIQVTTCRLSQHDLRQLPRAHTFEWGCCLDQLSESNESWGMHSRFPLVRGHYQVS